MTGCARTPFPSSLKPIIKEITVIFNHPLLSQAQQAVAEKRFDEARQLLLPLLSDYPDIAALSHILGCICTGQGDYNQAADHLEKAARLDTSNPQILYNYATVLQTIGNYHKALEYYRKALALKPDYQAALNNCCTVLNIIGQMTEAESTARTLITLNPDHIEGHTNLGNILKNQGRIDEALQEYQKSLQIDPSYAVARSNYLLTLCYCSADQQSIFEAHIKWAPKTPEEHLQKIENFSSLKAASIADKPLRIGYVSADFKTHSVAFFLEPILANHDKNRFTIICYADTAKPDPTTVRLQRYASVWRPVFGMPDQQLYQTILEDAIDILIDLSGHTANNRLTVFSRRAAPVQVSYLGYPNTTGIPSIDYRITDPIADPIGNDAYFTEQLYRLASGFLCYQPPRTPVAITPMLPCNHNGYITFGSFNNLPKISEKCITLWSSVLLAVARSHLVIKSKSFNDQGVKERFLNLFSLQSIDPSRIHLLGHAPSTEEHLACYNLIDIALDTVPYSGTTTTCEALWMGLAVISLAGHAHASRVSASLLTRVGLSSFVVSDEKSFIELAVFLAHNTRLLTQLRQNLRSAVTASALCDAVSFTRSLENAYLDMWQRLLSRLQV
ncbi:MAG: tetratricopeptide repeat protein [Chitinivibrionales bacterium]|nr:tetratricopeptide repeat protein [Chitinivibrionales bacterium]